MEMSQQVDDKSKFVLIETLTGDDAVNVHKTQKAYLEWKPIVAPWMAIPRVGVKHWLVQ